MDLGALEVDGDVARTRGPTVGRMLLIRREREVGGEKGMEITFSMLRDAALLPGMGMLAERDILELMMVVTRSFACAKSVQLSEL